MMDVSGLTYPHKFDEALKAKPFVRAHIDSALHGVASILSISKLPFFSDYTDHGIQHLNSVLEIADRLIPTEALPLFTAEDAAVLTFSILLHDLALHLSEGGFKSLLMSHSAGDEWTYKWEEFFSEAEHWDDHTLVDLFGADSAGAPIALVRDPFKDYDNLTETDRKLIGEFIRRHHPQLAAQFAQSGFPGVDGHTIELGTFDQELRRLAGIIACSHGFSLRASIGILEKEQFSRLESDHVHPLFLMGLLRIADFLELGSDRAPLIVFRYKGLKSPLSRREWKTNQSFRKISWGNPERESIMIPARPTDVESFLELERWLAAIQAELDTTWAVFGEVYGTNPNFSKLGLTIRRVRSNILDDPQQFQKSASFVARRVGLDVAGAQILKLFVEPLYGNHPEIGIRELLQNAVDAVRERREFEKKHSTAITPRDHAGEIEVWLDDPDDNGVALLTVTDKGIGMTEETVIDYFLTVGASFRRSVAWKTEFESKVEEGAAKIKARVLRSGRFGIGVLAAFLLGDEIEVTTRHVTRNRGLSFSMRLDLRPPAFEISPIQINYADNLEVGTTVKVKVTRVPKPAKQSGPHDVSFLESNIFTSPNIWDWYSLEEPRVVRLQGGEKKIVKQSYAVPSEDSPLPPNWHRVPSVDYSTVHILTRGQHKIYAPQLSCNGFKVQSVGAGLGTLFNRDHNAINWQDQIFKREGWFKVMVPSFSVFDPDGNLPLNLQRTGLTNLDLDFVKGAFDIQAKANLAQLLVYAPTEPKLTRDFVGVLISGFDFDQVFPIFFSREGVALLTPTNLRLSGVRNCLLLNSEAFAEGWLTSMYSRYDAIFVARWGEHHASPLYSLNAFFPRISSARVVTRNAEEPVVRKPLRFRYKIFSQGALSVYRSANCEPSLFTFEDLRPVCDEHFPSKENGEQFQSVDDFIAAELFLKHSHPFEEPTEFSVGRLWEQIVREPIIPFEKSKRIETLAHAYSELRAYLPIAEDTTT
jgi:molecular chaperone HtpG